MNYFLKGIITASPAQTSKQIINWWERRRLFYNMVMLAAGCITIVLALSLNEITFTELINVLPPVLIVAASANLFYTLGWIVELACRKFITQKETVEKAGPVLFIAGTGLSIFFTVAIDIAILIAFFFAS